MMAAASIAKEQINLSPCPNCGNAAEIHLAIRPQARWKTFHSVVCGVCGMRTPLYALEEYAVRAWEKMCEHACSQEG